ncbi:hypothetical protein AAG570_007154 [Ranatra chinensis]|uniref:Uncharacterized protein n=1 Tax=Ranatra chinensis TaxID=642074 RepID=A0ABD0YAA6_9HEMI
MGRKVSKSFHQNARVMGRASSSETSAYTTLPQTRVGDVHSTQALGGTGSDPTHSNALMVKLAVAKRRHTLHSHRPELGMFIPLRPWGAQALTPPTALGGTGSDPTQSNALMVKLAAAKRRHTLHSHRPELGMFIPLRPWGAQALAPPTLIPKIGLSKREVGSVKTPILNRCLTVVCLNNSKGPPRLVNIATPPPSEEILSQLFLFTASGGSGRNGGNGGDSSAPKRMVDITRDKPIKVTIRVVVPVRDHPKLDGTVVSPSPSSAVVLKPPDLRGISKISEVVEIVARNSKTAQAVRTSKLISPPDLDRD